MKTHGVEGRPRFENSLNGLDVNFGVPPNWLQLF